MFKVNNFLVKNTLASVKSEYYNKKIKAKAFKVLFLVLFIKVLHERKKLASVKDIVQFVCNFFCQNILNIHSRIPSSTFSQGMPRP